jgi:hypothetical protein
VTPASLENPASTQSSVPGQAARIARSAPIGDRAVLSLDSRDGAPMGPAILHEDPSAWPPEVIA